MLRFIRNIHQNYPCFISTVFVWIFEEPRVKTRGFSDPSGIFIFLLANARGIQWICFIAFLLGQTKSSCPLFTGRKKNRKSDRSDNVLADQNLKPADPPTQN